MIEQVEQVVRQGGGTLGLLAITVLLLVKEVIRGRNDKDVSRCPIIGSGGTPITKEQHDEVCTLKLAPIIDGIHRIEAEVKELPKKLNGGVNK